MGYFTPGRDGTWAWKISEIVAALVIDVLVVDRIPRLPGWGPGNHKNT